MILKESIESAIMKINNSYKAYEWILKNRESISTDDHDYKKYFSTAQQVFSAVDILLRCFIIEKKIPIIINKKK